MLIDTINAFKQKFRGLQNLTKFTNKEVMERLEIVILWMIFMLGILHMYFSVYK